MNFSLTVLFTVVTSAGLLSARHPGMDWEKMDMDPMCTSTDLVFVLDSSATIEARNWAKVLQFVSDFINELVIGPDNIQVGLLTFGNKAHIQFYLDTYSDVASMLQVIQDIPWMAEGTNTSGALWMLREQVFQEEHGDREGVPNVAVVITDGVSNRFPHETLEEARKTKESGITIFALGVGTGVNMVELEAIASQPAEKFVNRTETFDMLSIMNINIMGLTCHTTKMVCRDPADLVLMLDSSSTVGLSHFNLIKNSLASMLSMLMHQHEPVYGLRVGLLAFSSSTLVQFHLNEYQNKTELAQAIRDVPYSSGSPGFADALRTLMTGMFTADHGDRPKHRNVALIFTDHSSPSYRETLSAAAEAKAAGITLAVVAMGNWINIQEIYNLASWPPESNVIHAADYHFLPQSLPLVKEAICNNIDECEDAPCAHNSTCFDDVHVYFCECPPPLAGPNCQSVCAEPADLVVVLDSSTGISMTDFSHLLSFVRTLAFHLNPNTTHLGVASYADEVQTWFTLSTENKQEWINLLSLAPQGGTTVTASALSHMREAMFNTTAGDRPGVPNIGLLITDGAAYNRSETFAEAVRLHEAAITLLVIGVNVEGGYRQRELHAITSDPDEWNLINVESYEGLVQQAGSLSSRLLDTVCQRKDYCASQPCSPHGRCLQKINSYDCACAKGWTGLHCEKGCDGEMDILFLLDVSGGIRQSRFSKIKSWVISLISQMEIHPNRTRVGVVTFNEVAKAEIYLDTYQLKEDILNAIKLIEYRFGKTNIAAALRTARNMLNTVGGGRPHVPHFAVLVTDGDATVQRDRTLREAADARMDGIHIIVISPEGGTDRLEFRGIASPPAYNIFTVPRYGLSKLTTPVLNALCNSNDECQDTPCENGGKCLDFIRTYMCICSHQYTGRHCERTCTRRHDVVFGLDTSVGSDIELGLAIDLIHLIVQGLNFDGGRTRVGAMTYGDKITTQFHLNAHHSKEEVLNSLTFLRGIGSTGSHQALKWVNKEMFTALHGDRQGDDNIIILITDGHSKDKDSSSIEVEDTRVMVVGRGEDVHRQRLGSLASQPESENLFFLETEAQLYTIANTILNLLCQ